MKRMGPILTLAAGVLLAAVVMVLNINGYAAKQRAASNNQTQPTPTSPDLAETTAPSPPQPLVEPPVTYAGNVGGGGASIAIAVKDGKAIAYLCDGATAEAWLQGTAPAGSWSSLAVTARVSSARTRTAAPPELSTPSVENGRSTSTRLRRRPVSTEPTPRLPTRRS
jgi:hypothetical protein